MGAQSKNNRAAAAAALIFILLLCPLLLGAAKESARDARAAILDEYFPPELVSRMRTDANSVIDKFNHINIFSTAQYGTSFLEGVADTGHVFDARITANMRIFREYARQHLLILNKSEKEGYAMFALGAAEFLREFEYDCVLFHPDEYHPVFTQERDTWMFLREEPVSPAGVGVYYSAQVRRRRVTVEGGLSMEALNRADLPQFYIPTAATRYLPYHQVDGELIESTMRPEVINRYARALASDATVKKRSSRGIIPSPLSLRRGVRVGAWVKAEALEEKWKTGFRFSGNERAYTWSACGIYVLPLERDFWN